MVLDDNIILQGDGTVIAGLLVLLTVTYIQAPKGSHEQGYDLAIPTIKRISKVAAIVVSTFSASAILVILGTVIGPYTFTVTIFNSHDIPVTIFGSYTIMLTNFGKYVMIGGFVTLPIGIIWILWYWIKMRIGVS